MQDTVTQSGDDVSDKRAKQALENTHVVLRLDSPQTNEHDESEEHRQASSKWCRH
jgi:hypothetical protein